MKVDRKMFLALTMAIAGGASAACSSGGDGTSSTEGAVSAGAACIINPTTESVSGPAAEGANQVLGFDPVNNFSAAEGFCFDRTFGQNASLKTLQDISKQQIYAKCNSYGKLYVPWTMREAYQQIQRQSRSGTLTFAMLYAIDKQITSDKTICATSAATSMCKKESDKAGCTTLASQMKPEQQSKLSTCMDAQHFNAFTCAEGGLVDLPGASNQGPSSCLIDPTTESISGPAAEGANAVLGFDPVNDFPAAESFCFDRTFGQNAPDSVVLDTAHQQIYAKCNSYAKLYVPWSMREAYQQIQKNSSTGTLSFDTMYAIDRQLVGDKTICSTSAAQTLCANEKDKAACLTLASQMVPSAQPKLTACTDGKGFDVFTCAEGLLVE
jgi:hypothetical protein